MSLNEYCSYEKMKGVFPSSLYLSLFLFIMSVLFLFIVTKRTKSKRKLNLPPFPPKLPIIGNIHHFGAVPHRSLRDLSLKYGDMMMLQMGQKSTPCLVVSSAEVAREIMKNHDQAFSNRDQSTAGKMCVYGCTEIGLGPYGESWREKRKICVSQFLNTKMVQSFRAIRGDEVAELVNKIREVSSGDARHVNVSEMLLSIPMGILYKCIFGGKYSEDSYTKVTASVRRVQAHLAAFTVRDHFPLLGWVDVLTGKIAEYKSTFQALDSALDQAIADSITAKTQSSQKKLDFVPFVDILLQLQQNGMLNIHLTNNDIKGLITDFFVGGTDSVAIALEWAISELVKNPTMMKRVQEEVRTIVGHKTNVEENHVSQMHYLKCVVKETLRLHPPTPLLAPRETISGVKMNGYDIPAKSRVFINAFAIQTDPKYWERPEEFLPERFENSPVDFNNQGYFEFVPFGFGRRGCPGMTFAVTSIEYVLASLVYWFDWKLPIGTQDLDMTDIFGFVASRKSPLHLRPEPFSF